MTELFAPPGYHELSPPEKERICNGCGTKGLGGFIVADTLWGAKITECCHIHDYMWHIGKTIDDKDHADRVFLNNMLRVIDEGSKWLKWLRRRKAYRYYEAVSMFGGPAFWKGKE